MSKFIEFNFFNEDRPRIVNTSFLVWIGRMDSKDIKYVFNEEGTKFAYEVFETATDCDRRYRQLIELLAAPEFKDANEYHRCPACESVFGISALTKWS